MMRKQRMDMKKRIVLSLLLCVCICFSFSSCIEKTEKYSEDSFEYFDTVSTVTGYAKSREDFDRICGEIFEELSEYHCNLRIALISLVSRLDLCLICSFFIVRKSV